MGNRHLYWILTGPSFAVWRIFILFLRLTFVPVHLFSPPPPMHIKRKSKEKKDRVKKEVWETD
jgi:hypothetical protein